MAVQDYGYYYYPLMPPAPTYPIPNVTTVSIPVNYPPTYPCPPPEVVSPALTVLHTKDLPLTLTKSLDSLSEKKMGKSLSCYTKNMEMVWHGEFNRLCQNLLPARWYLSPSFDVPSGRSFVTFRDSAKVRFLCKNCAHGWTSMKGRVIFWFMLDERTSTGIVFFRLFGQKCQSCSPDWFEHAMWYPEEVIKVIGNLFNRIGQEYYGFYSPPVRIDRRAGKPQAKHNADFCQACAEGVCPKYNQMNPNANYNLVTATSRLAITER